MNDDRPSFLRGAIRPMECFKAGWELVKNDYWLFLGITVVGSLIAGAAPLGILLGPMFCGIFYSLFHRMRGQPVKFEMLFRGFDQFVPSLIVALLMMVPFMALMFVGYGVIFAIFVATLPNQPGGGPPGSGATTTFLTAWVVFILLVIVLQIVIQVLFFFAFPLIVDRKLSGMDAVKTSFQAARANFGGVIGLVLINVLLSVAGSMACCVGQFFVMPLHYAAIAVAYRAVFPPDAPPEAPADGPVADYDDARLDAPPEQG